VVEGFPPNGDDEFIGCCTGGGGGGGPCAEGQLVGGKGCGWGLYCPGILELYRFAADDG